MPVKSFLLMSSLLIIMLQEALVFGTDTYEFGENCPKFTKVVDLENELYVVYNGKTVSSDCDIFKFRGRGEDEYSVCVTSLYFNDNGVELDCGVEIDITFSRFMRYKITCNEIYNAKYCGYPGEILYIEFKNPYGGNTSEANFKLKITAKKKYDYGDDSRSSDSIGTRSFIGGLALFALALLIFCLCVCIGRQKLSQGRNFDPAQEHPEFPYVIYPDQTQPSTVATPSNISSLDVYPVAPHQHGELHTTENRLSYAPPSYDALTTDRTRI